jgi:hypothetical protein
MQKGGNANMTTTELNNRKYTLIEEIMRIDSDAVIEKIEKLIDMEKRYKKSPLSYTLEELKQEVAEAENETVIHSQEEVKAMSWKK